MPNKHFYFSLGLLHGTVIVLIVRRIHLWLTRKYKIVRSLYQYDPDWFLYFPFFIGFMGGVGLIPDILHGLRILPKEMTRSTFFNIFYFHSYFEWLEDEKLKVDAFLNILASVFLFLLSVGILLFYVREIKRIISENS